MEESKECVFYNRLKREDCKNTKNDSDFSEWKVLIGPSDWEDHSSGKEGAERYRVHNLPNCSSCSGVYEFGIAAPRTCSRHEKSKLDPNRIIPVYLGQADNVRTRLQRYGHEGAHLENGNSAGELNDSVQQGLGLFSDIFSRGYSIVYRWAPMKNKKVAEKTEAKLLGRFDYAWNKGNNGVRRHNDILQKLDQSTSGNTQCLANARKLQTFHQKKTVIKIESYKPLLLENGPSIYTNLESNDLLSRILKIGRSQPRIVSLRYGFNEDHANICRVALGHGSVCRSPPVEGRKRCAEHKGMKINGFSYSTVKPQLVQDNCSICGVTLDDGTPCKRQPVQGRKRCEEHKGRKIKGSLSESVTEGKQPYVRGPVLESRTYANEYEQISSETRQSHRPKAAVFPDSSIINKKLETICGVDSQNGTFCTRQPVTGRKRCEEHKWMKVNGFKADIPNVFDGTGIGSSSGRKYDNASCQSFSYRSVNEDFSSTCGATLADGSSCRRPPAEGRKRCWQHKGMRVNSGGSYNFTSMYNNGGFSSDICGAALRNGSICSRMPVHGRKRCEQHKGMRTAF